jgi:hypothetical protein
MLLTKHSSVATGTVHDYTLTFGAMGGANNGIL